MFQNRSIAVIKRNAGKSLDCFAAEKPAHQHVQRDNPECLPQLAELLPERGRLHVVDVGRYQRVAAVGANRMVGQDIGAVMDQARDPVISQRVDELLDVAGAIVEPVTAEQASIARSAYRDFGRSSGHAAGLDFGDCFS